MIESSVPTRIEPAGRLLADRHQLTTTAPRLLANIYDPFYGSYDANSADCTGPLAEQFQSDGNAGCSPQFPGNKIPAKLSAPGVSGQSQLFARLSGPLAAAQPRATDQQRPPLSIATIPSASLDPPTNTSSASMNPTAATSTSRPASAVPCSPTTSRRRSCMRLSR